MPEISTNTDWAALIAGVEAEPPTSFDPIPDGRYTATIEGGETRVSAAGNEYIRARYRIVSDGPFKNRVVFGNFHFTSTGAFRITLQSLKHIGFTHAYFVDENPTKADILEKAVGWTVEVRTQKDPGDSAFDNYSVYINGAVSSPEETAALNSNPVGLPVPATVLPAAPVAAPAAAAPAAAAPVAAPAAAGPGSPSPWEATALPEPPF